MGTTSTLRGTRGAYTADFTYAKGVWICGYLPPHWINHNTITMKSAWISVAARQIFTKVLGRQGDYYEGNYDFEGRVHQDPARRI